MAVVYYKQKIWDPKTKPKYYERAKLILPEGEITAREGSWEYARSVSAHMLVRTALMNRYGIFDGKDGICGSRVIIGRRDGGCPYFVSPVGFFVSITHSGSMAACAVSAVAAVGVDVQPVGKIAPRVLEALYTENEREYVGSDPVRFTEIWTRKESFVKMLGTGITRDLGSVDTLTGENTNGAVFTTERIGKKFLTLCTERAVQTEFRGL